MLAAMTGGQVLPVVVVAPAGRMLAVVMLLVGSSHRFVAHAVDNLCCSSLCPCLRGPLI